MIMLCTDCFGEKVLMAFSGLFRHVHNCHFGMYFGEGVGGAGGCEGVHM